MSLESTIKQSKFRNEYQKVNINLLVTYNWMIERMRTFFDSADLTMQQYNVLRILRGSHPQPLSTLQIRDRMIDKMSDVSRIVDRLIKKELVMKVTCQNDKRLVDVNVTEKGIALLKKLDRRMNNLEASLQNITMEEATQLNALLDKLRGED
jgi:MarR family transcriptional regulator, 2-MHQ and catechol-resistance regulon repressor